MMTYFNRGSNVFSTRCAFSIGTIPILILFLFISVQPACSSENINLVKIGDYSGDPGEFNILEIKHIDGDRFLALGIQNQSYLMRYYSFHEGEWTIDGEIRRSTDASQEDYLDFAVSPNHVAYTREESYSIHRHDNINSGRGRGTRQYETLYSAIGLNYLYHLKFNHLRMIIEEENLNTGFVRNYLVPDHIEPEFM